jgi:uncharacterized membrane protein YedE/YeeE
MKFPRPLLFVALATTAIVAPTMASAAEIAVDARQYPGPAWSPYLVGALLGILSWLTFYFSDKPLGASSFYATLAGMIGKLFAKKHTDSLAYYKSNPPVPDWEFALVIATVGGAFIAAFSGGEITNQWLPPMWEARFGEGTLGLRAVVALFGGVLMAFGARLAGGCTSGHGISGTLQLNVGSWIAVICFFLGGIAVAMPLFAQ